MPTAISPTAAAAGAFSASRSGLSAPKLQLRTLKIMATRAELTQTPASGTPRLDIVGLDLSNGSNSRDAVVWGDTATRLYDMIHRSAGRLSAANPLPLTLHGYWRPRQPSEGLAGAEFVVKSFDSSQLTEPSITSGRAPERKTGREVDILA